MLKWSIKTMPFEFKFTWSIARASMAKKTGYFIEVEEDGLVGMGEVAGITKGPEETDFIREFESKDFKGISKPADVYDVEMSAPFRFGMESALTHLICKKQGFPVWKILGLNEPRDVPTSISLPILPPDEVADFIEKYDFNRFSCCKIKVGAQHAAESVQQVAKHFKGSLRVDANEAFGSHQDVLQFLECVDLERLQFLEQPMPAEKIEEYTELKKHSPIPIVADESIQDQMFDSSIVDQFHGINVKLMKAGGYHMALDQLNKAKSLGLKTMLGCMVESSLGISSAMNISSGVNWLDLDGFLIIKNEPFGLVEEKNGLLNLKAQ